MLRFYTCTHKSSRKWYFRLFWFLVDLAVDNTYVLECLFRDRTPGQGRCRNKQFCKELATELLSKYSSQEIPGCQVQNAPARLIQQYFSANLGTDCQCAACSKEHTQKRYRYSCRDCGNLHLCVAPCIRIYHTRL